MRILFCKISSMKYYKGACDADEPRYGGKFVEENGYGHEELNFCPVLMDDSEEEECVGFVEPMSNRGYTNSLHIEKIEGCAAFNHEPFVDDVLVVWCAKMDDHRGITVVGWYKHARVWRNLQEWTLTYSDGSEDERNYNVRAKASNCVLLPPAERTDWIWKVHSAKYTKAYGFGQHMVWYPTEPEAEVFVSRLLNNIEKYRGENWLNKYPED